MKTDILVLAFCIAGMALTSCKKNKDNMPALDGVNGHITNIDGKDIHFSSATNNTAKTEGSTNALFLEFNDSKSQVKIELTLYDISLQNPENYILKDSTRMCFIHILSNPVGRQYFTPDFYAPDNGTIDIATITKDHVIGVIKKAILKGGGSTTVTLHDCKFNLIIE